MSAPTCHCNYGERCRIPGHDMRAVSAHPIGGNPEPFPDPRPLEDTAREFARDAELLRLERYSAARRELEARMYYGEGFGGERYSADAGDYWSAPDDAPFGALVRGRHPWRTSTGRTVYAPRTVKRAATVRDLRRLARAAGEVD